MPPEMTEEEKSKFAADRYKQAVEESYKHEKEKWEFDTAYARYGNPDWMRERKEHLEAKSRELEAKDTEREAQYKNDGGEKHTGLISAGYRDEVRSDMDRKISAQKEQEKKQEEEMSL